jgi:hypothetical protein
VMTK